MCVCGRRLNRAAQHELECDSVDKMSALNLDSTCHQMRNSSRGIQYYNGIHFIDNTSVMLSLSLSLKLNAQKRLILEIYCCDLDELVTALAKTVKCETT